MQETSLDEIMIGRLLWLSQIILQIIASGWCRRNAAVR